MASPIRVLVVDDQETVLLNTAAYLEYADFEVMLASNGERALQIVANEHIDVGIIDIRLPGMDGNDVIVEAHRLQPDMKFLILTGSLNYLMPESLKQLGIKEAHSFSKPLPDMKALVHMINRLVSRGK